MRFKVFSRAFAQGKVKQLQRMRKPLTVPLVLTTAPPRNPVVYAMAHRSASAGAGKHIRSQGATRRATTVALHKLVREQAHD